MKKVLMSCFLTLLLVSAFYVSGISFSASAEKEGYYTYSVSNGEAKITSVSSSISGEVKTPEFLGGCPVTSIGNHAFDCCDSLLKITISEGVVNIGDFAFDSCSNLIEVTISDSVTNIGANAFAWCTSLIKINFGSNLSHISDWMFQDCSSLKCIVIPSSVTKICDYAFYGCISLMNIEIPNSVVSIGKETFRECSSLTNIEIPDSVMYIGKSAFEMCDNLSKITLPFVGAANIQSDLYESETNFEYIFHVIPSSLKEVVVTKTINIASEAFRNCKNLISITLPDELQSIGDGAFSGCEKLTSINIPNKVTSIGNYAFDGCGKLKSLIIGDGVITIGEGAFSGCESLVEVSIPNGVEKIGAETFLSCDNLKKIKLSDNLISIGESAFHSCYNLKSITIPDSVKHIGDGAFYCTGLEEVHITDIKSWCEIDFEDFTANPLYHAKRLYLNDVLLTDLIIAKGTNKIAKYAFYNCNNIKNVIIPNSVQEIGEDAFYECQGIISVIIPDSVTCIGSGAFYNCISVKDIWYTGANKSNFDLQNNNNELYNAIWHYNTCKEEHNYSGACDVACNNCEWIRTRETQHTFCNVCDADCNICGATREITHIYNNSKSNETYHWKECDCGAVYDKQAHVYNILKSDDEYHWRECGCGKEEFEYRFGHGYSRCFDNDSHWLECECGHKTDIESHNFNTLKNDDTMHWKECFCGKIAEKTKHNLITTTTKATTSKNGSIVKKCSVCGKVVSSKTIYYAKSFSLSTTSCTYNGNAKTPSVTVKDSKGNKLKNGTDYTVSYPSGRKNIGTYKVKVTLRGNYTGSKTLSFTINPKIKLSTTKYTYNGKARKPSVTVTNSSGSKISTKYYSVSYSSGRKKVGTYTVTVKFKSVHSGTYKQTFTIAPKGTSVSKLTAGKKSLKVSIKKQSSQTTGYQIQYSTSKKFSSKYTKSTTVSNKTTTKTIKSLKAKKTYYVRVRTYKTVGGKKYYSGWSTVKYKKTK